MTTNFEANFDSGKKCSMSPWGQLASIWLSHLLKHVLKIIWMKTLFYPITLLTTLLAIILKNYFGSGPSALFWHSLRTWQ